MGRIIYCIIILLLCRGALAQAGQAAFAAIEKAIELAQSNRIQAVLTGPISKEAIHLDSHIVFFVVGYLASFLFRSDKDARDLTLYGRLAPLEKPA
jgi:hypothetical protein